ncbi:MAG: hypothetical protein L6R41_007073 [Letrouitia leprolyta]|nr:MAG: hypothetical protein L6R41_007073 [Letrouitia leprolyta]
MRMSVDGACRRNGYQGAIAAAAVIIHHRRGGYQTWTRRLPEYPQPTNQAAELTAIILALERAMDFYNQSDKSPYMRVTIITDSKYAYGCMKEWCNKWVNNGWVNSAGREVANRDLIQEALDLQAEIEQDGNVEYEWVPRAQNEEADRAVNDALDDANDSGDESLVFSDYD